MRLRLRLLLHAHSGLKATQFHSTCRYCSGQATMGQAVNLIPGGAPYSKMAPCCVAQPCQVLHPAAPAWLSPPLPPRCPSRPARCGP